MNICISLDAFPTNTSIRLGLDLKRKICFFLTLTEQECHWIYVALALSSGHSEALQQMTAVHCTEFSLAQSELWASPAI